MGRAVRKRTREMAAEKSAAFTLLNEHRLLDEEVLSKELTSIIVSRKSQDDGAGEGLTFRKQSTTESISFFLVPNFLPSNPRTASLFLIFFPFYFCYRIPDDARGGWTPILSRNHSYPKESRRREVHTSVSVPASRQ